MNLTLQSFKNNLLELPAGTHRLWVAYSGGVDSQVLLHLLSELKASDDFPYDFPYVLAAIHVHHGISPNADDWLQHCKQCCEQLSIEFHSEHIQLNDQGNIEEQARHGRYQVFEQKVTAGDCLLIAHHQDDQAETFLLRLIRGAGPKGLAAMPKQRPMGEAHLYRPLLTFSRQAIEQYAEQHQLTWIDDESNDDQHYSRNYIRHSVVPVLKDRWPSVADNLSRTAAICGESHGLLTELAAEDFSKINQQHALCINGLCALSHARQLNLLRYCIEQLQLPMPSQQQLLQVLSDVVMAAEDASPCVKWPGAEARRFKKRLYLMAALPEHDVKHEFVFNPAEELVLPTGCLRASLKQGLGLKQFPEYTVRFRQGGEQVRIAGKGITQSLKKLLQEAQVTPWLRDRVPLIYVGDELAAVAGFWVCEGFWVGEDGDGEDGVFVEWLVGA